MNNLIRILPEIINNVMQKILILFLTLTHMSLHVQIGEQSNKHFWHRVETSASPQKIWQIWTDVKNWQQWDAGLKQAEMTDDFSLNNSGIITSLDNRKSKFTIIAYEEGKSYTFKTKLPLGSLYVKRFLETNDGKTYFTHEVWFAGLTGGIFAKQFGPKFREMLPNVLESIKKIAEKS
jgi:hypothetical protein